MISTSRNDLVIPFLAIKQSGAYDGIYDENVILVDMLEEEILLENEESEQEVTEDLVYDDDCENESVIDDDLIVTQMMQELGQKTTIRVGPLPYSTPMAQA